MCLVIWGLSGWWDGGGPRLRGSGGLSLVGFNLGLFYLAVFRARGALPPLSEGVCYLFFYSTALARFGLLSLKN